MEKQVFLASPRGFCSGVERALKLVEDQLDRNPSGTPLFLLHQIVHNESVVKSFVDRGVRVVETLDKVPDGASVIFSAHGVSRLIDESARRRGLRIIDATCPLVKSVQKKAEELSSQNIAILLFGKRGHREVEGIMGRIVSGGSIHVIGTPVEAEAFQPVPGIAYATLSQTTLNSGELDEMTAILKRKIPSLHCVGNVCRATSDRQNAVKRLAARCDAVLVVGSASSSNSKRLVEIARSEGKKGILIENGNALKLDELEHIASVGITSGASAPECLVQGVLNSLIAAGFHFSGEL